MVTILDVVWPSKRELRKQSCIVQGIGIEHFRTDGCMECRVWCAFCQGKLQRIQRIVTELLLRWGVLARSKRPTCSKLVRYQHCMVLLLHHRIYLACRVRNVYFQQPGRTLLRYRVSSMQNLGSSCCRFSWILRKLALQRVGKASRSLKWRRG